MINKIRLVIICVLAVLIILTGCTNSENSDGNSFIATVLENNESSLLIAPEYGSAELRSADQINVSIKDTLLNSQDKEITINDIEAGKQVEVYYTGGIAESYPAQIHGCYKIKLLN